MDIPTKSNEILLGFCKKPELNPEYPEEYRGSKQTLFFEIKKLQFVILVLWLLNLADRPRIAHLWWACKFGQISSSQSVSKARHFRWFYHALLFFIICLSS